MADGCAFMKSDDMYSDLVRLMNSVQPKSCVSPENRNVARLVITPCINRGSIYRIALPELFDDNLPRIMIHPKDAASISELFNAHQNQEVADLCEECFAHQELHAN